MVRPNKVHSKSEGCGMPARYVLAVMGHLGAAVGYTLRANLSVALVSMVNSTWANMHSTATLDPECRRDGENSTTTVENVSTELKRHIL